MLFQDLSCSWAADSSVAAVEVGGNCSGSGECAMPVKDVTFRSMRAWWPGDLVLKELCLALPAGSLTAIVGDVGAGAHGPVACVKFAKASLMPSAAGWEGGCVMQDSRYSGIAGELLRGVHMPAHPRMALLCAKE